MRCQKHFADLSSVDGVCATCLRQRLLIIIEAQTQADLQKKSAKNNRRSSSEGSSPDHEEVFQRSGSTDVACRKLDNSSVPSQNGQSISIQKFYSTPQVVFRKKNKFSIVSHLFRSNKPSDLVSDPNFDLKAMESCSAATSTSWISSIFSSKQKKKKKSRMFTLTDTNASRVMQRPCRGMSPAGESDNEFCDGETPKSSPQRKETPQWKETPQRTAPPVQFQCKRLYQARNLTGFAFCLSPLVRPSPNRNWNQKGIPPELAIAGDVRIPVKPHIGIASRYCPNRSKKLANCGRFHSNY